jgi:uncharacterized membrane protein
MLLDAVADCMVPRRSSRDEATRSRRRSLAKTLTWRLFATFDIFITGLVTGSLRWAGSIVSIEIPTKSALYLVHERASASSGWGASPSRRCG